MKKTFKPYNQPSTSKYVRTYTYNTSYLTCPSLEKGSELQYKSKILLLRTSQNVPEGQLQTMKTNSILTKDAWLLNLISSLTPYLWHEFIISGTCQLLHIRFA